MLATLATYTNLLSEITAGVMHVTLIRLPFKNENCNQYHLLSQLIGVI